MHKPALFANVAEKKTSGRKYLQLKRQLLDAISDGVWPPGTKLPTEQELVEMTPYSLGTVQRAMRELVRDGLVERRQGRGSFVRENRQQMHDPWHCRFLSDDGQSFLPIYPRVVLREHVSEDGPWSAYLGAAEGGIVRVDRVMSVNDEFLIYNKFYIPDAYCGPLLTRPLTEIQAARFSQFLVEEFNIPITRIHQAFRVETLPADICEALAVELGQAGTRLIIVAQLANGNYLYYQEIFIPPNGRELHLLDSHPPGD
ncbi:MAG: GntR family transcriptional regulator [Dichotomicrobium sp.]